MLVSLTGGGARAGQQSLCLPLTGAHSRPRPLNTSSVGLRRHTHYCVYVALPAGSPLSLRWAGQPDPRGKSYCQLEECPI